MSRLCQNMSVRNRLSGRDRMLYPALMTTTRYAIYHVPSGRLGQVGASWLGWDAVQGKDMPPPDVPGLPIPRAAITATPRKYGFHGTIKPPFRLAEGYSAGTLKQHLATFCETRAPVTLEGLELARLGRFLALVPVGNPEDLTQLAAEVVARFDPFRAPLTAGELARRKVERLTPAQRRLLDRWGYPHVMDAFRFHLTLTSKLPKSDAQRVHGALAPWLAPALPRPYRIDALSLMKEDADGQFRVSETFNLNGTK